MIDGRLLLFLSKVGSVESGLGFEARGLDARVVVNPQDRPDKWTMHSAQLPEVPWCESFGSAVEISLDTLYAFCCNFDHAISLARWSLDSAQNGSLGNPEWWCGDSIGWVTHAELNGRAPDTLFANGATEFSVWRDSASGQFLLIQTEGFGQAELVLRRATALTGPWSPPETVFDPPENNIPDIMIYAAKAHPHLTSGGTVLTYATNGSERSVLADSTIYYPRFVRMFMKLSPQDSAKK
jgi:hypothetical protein